MSSSVTRMAGQISLPAGTTTGNGSSLDNGGSCSNHNVVTIGSAGISAGTVQLQGSMDNINWVNIGAAITLVASTVQSLATPFVVGQPYQFIRAIVGTTITGGTVTAWVASSG